MKKLLIVFFLCLAVTSYIGANYQVLKNEVDREEGAGKNTGTLFWVPDSSVTSGPESWKTVYPLILKAARDAGVNVVRTSVGYDNNNDTEITQFLLETRPSRIFKYFHLKSGRFPTVEETQKSGAFVSSYKDKSKDETGELKTFSKEPLVSILPLKKLPSYDLPASGRYMIETENSQSYRKFVGDFLSLINPLLTRRNIKPFKTSELTSGSRASLENACDIRGEVILDKFRYMPFLILIVTALLLVYYCFYRAKRIGIMKLQGIGLPRIWYSLVGRLIFVTFVISSAALVVVSIAAKGIDAEFLAGIMKAQILNYGALLAASVTVVPYIISNRVSDAIGNRKHTGSILAANTVLKVAFTLVLTASAVSTMALIGEISVERNQIRGLRDTDLTSGYGVIYPATLGYGEIEFSVRNEGEEYAEVRSLYPFLNRAGALYIDAGDYETDSLEQPLQKGEFRTVSINRNYLNRFPLYDSSGRRITLPERTHAWVVLVPEEYRDKEAMILKSTEKDRRYKYNFTVSRHFSAPLCLKNQPVQIIWTKKGQKIESLDPKVFPKQGNEIIDPIINVVTEGNSVFEDEVGHITGDVTSSVKVKLIGEAPGKRSSGCPRELKRLHLDSYFTQSPSMEDSITEDLAELRKNMVGSVLSIVLIAAFSLFLVLQNLMIFFSRNKKKFLVRRLFGLDILHTYIEYFKYFIAIWFVQFVAGLLAFQQSKTSVLILCCIFLAVELAASVIFIMILERRNLGMMLKEE